MTHAKESSLGTTKERPILFSGPMVRAILDGRKTQTRRLLNPAPPSIEAVHDQAGDGFSIFTDHHAKPDEYRVAGPVWAVRKEMGREPKWRCPYGAPGDRLWVRETWAPVDWFAFGYAKDEPVSIGYAADRAAVCHEANNAHALDTYGWNWDVVKWKPSIHMPRWASRITLEVTGVRVERLGDISEEDARAEGVELVDAFGPTVARDMFRSLWDGINGERALWASNPWVWVVEFRRVEEVARAA